MSPSPSNHPADRPSDRPADQPAAGSSTSARPGQSAGRAKAASKAASKAATRPAGRSPQPPASRRRAAWISLFVVVALVGVLGAALLGSRVSTDTAAAASVVRQDSHRLAPPASAAGASGGEQAGTPQVTLVEFLDFECEACGAVYPFVEQLREEYAGRVTFVMRYFPLDGHFNSLNAAVAVEAAAQQGQLEAMYSKMYETQTEWAEQQVSKADVFRGYAQELGLDMAAYDAAVADPATEARVRSDFDDGIALDVTGTPTFFLDGEKIQPQTEQEFRSLLDDALNQ